MDLGLGGKRALVTGASRGLGAAIAASLAQEGCSLVLVARDGEKLKGLASDLKAVAAHIEVVTLAKNLRLVDDFRRLAAEAGPVDILVNNAGDIPSGRLGDIGDVAWREAWNLKVFGYINLTREIYAEMQARRHGVIVNIAGTTGERPKAEAIAVSSGNAALIAFSRALGAESVRYGVRVVAVNPGASETDRQLKRWKARAAEQFGDAERWRELVADYPFGRLAKPAEIADVVTFLASARASYVSGTTLTIDAGSGR